MKQFLYKTFLFSLVSLMVIITLFVLLNKGVKKKANFKIDEDITNIIVGHSHSECAFNDALIDHTKNFSISGESYFYTYTKVKELVKANANIQTVFIELSNNAITERMHEWIWEDLYLSERLPTYFPILQTDELLLLLRKNKSGFLSASSKVFRENIHKTILTDFDYSNKIGKYQRLEGSDIDSLLLTHEPEILNIRNISFDNYNIQYLRKIVDFLNQENISVIFVRSPQHENYLDYNNETYFLKFKDSVFPNVEFLDFNNFPVKKIEFKDFGHLNAIGSDRLSIWFNDLMKKGLLTIENKEAFVKQEINKIE